MIEIWSEKFEPVIGEIADRFGCNYQLFSGTASLTRTRQLFERVKMAERPLALIYLSDFDVEGRNMPKSVSRSLEYMIYDEGLDYDIQVIHLMLTEEQVLDRELPPKPISTKHKKLPKNYLKWNKEFGGQVEITAMIALYPDEFEEILIEAINNFTVQSDRPASKIQEWSDEFDRLMDGFSNDFDSIKQDAASLVKDYMELNERLKKQLQKPFSTHRTRHDATAPALDALFDSRRDYIDQMAQYKRE